MSDKIYYIVDASVLAKLFFPEPQHNSAKIFFKHSFRNNWQLIAPFLIDYEFGNICWKKVQRNEITHNEATEILNNFQRIFLTRIDMISFIKDILKIAIQTQSTFYDSSYLVLARILNTKFITADEAFLRKIADKFPENIICLKDIDQIIEIKK